MTSLSHLIEVYFLLFIDSLVAALILPLNKIVIFKIMYYFGGYNTTLMIIIATLGSLIGGLVNLILGRIIIHARMEYHNSEQLQHKFIPYITKIVTLLVLIISWIPFWGALVNALSGYLKSNIMLTLVAISISYLVYFILIIL
ncbi:DedA family protein [Neoehrlichia mikurensis]|uniref:DedA family protein n=1 Tax=Neoehrlichia mikurensis TaxID=89586 RepID=A0A9Q9BS51_9RICK|nr:DedA family protein [Neoehrlichia mikurensis]QXK92163.1 DedA family protein [Neoehrlichia mikurensis]QXK92618.1 DedA family protein [Neoehrlichia mikurensis]QXK93857.1 DedA family protein [Neoehrlichia mikurensis]UTO55147.1 DedA family protein [Neoehrlichia mikurensis]UTO56068.1 DedA family protein [Neoehrlichia mikurensis]